MGKSVYADGNVHLGEYFQDKKEGFGIYTWTDGSKYEGYFANDEAHGFALYTNPNGESLLTFWIKDKHDKTIVGDPNLKKEFAEYTKSRKEINLKSKDLEENFR